MSNTKTKRKANKVSKAKAAKVATAPKKQLEPAMVAKAKQLIKKLPVSATNEKPGIIACIMQLYTKGGFTRSQIVALGYNRSTVYRQTRELDKLRNLKNKKQITGDGVVALTAKSLG